LHRRIQSLNDYGPSSEYPFGRYNPNAPIELKEFEFMIGNFDRTDSLFDQKSGKWNVFKNNEWNTKYIMNGHAILDQSWNVDNQIAASNLRYYDTKKKKWVISWWSNNNNGTPLVSEGIKEGDQFIFRNERKLPNGKTSVQEYIFYDISENAYKWRGQIYINNKPFTFWKISCIRKI